MGPRWRYGGVEWSRMELRGSRTRRTSQSMRITILNSEIARFVWWWVMGDGKGYEGPKGFRPRGGGHKVRSKKVLFIRRIRIPGTYEVGTGRWYGVYSSTVCPDQPVPIIPTLTRLSSPTSTPTYGAHTPRIVYTNATSLSRSPILRRRRYSTVWSTQGFRGAPSTFVLVLEP